MAFTEDESADARPDFDPAVADQVSTLVLTTGLQNFQTNSLTARNGTVANAIGLTLGVQRCNMAMMKQQFSIGVLQAGANANLVASALPTQLSPLGT